MSNPNLFCHADNQSPNEICTDVYGVRVSLNKVPSSLLYTLLHSPERVKDIKKVRWTRSCGTRFFLFVSFFVWAPLSSTS